MNNKKLSQSIFVLALVVYLIAIFRRISEFPPYFFCDEAVVGVDAMSLLTTGRDSYGVSWPFLFQGLGDYALSLTVYLQMPLIALFGLSESVVRSRAAIMSLVGVGAISGLFILIRGKTRVWLVPLLLAASVFWNLHSRTGFEYIDATAFFYLALFTSLLCIDGKKIWPLIAGISWACCFYAYTPGRGWALTGSVALLLAALTEWRRSWRTILLCVLFFAVFLVPYAWVYFTDPDAAVMRFRAIGGNRMLALPMAELLKNVSSNYAQALNPIYWFVNTSDMHPRHSVPGFSLIPWWLLPFWGVGLCALIWGWRNVYNRSLIFSTLAVPFTASLVEISTARCLPVGVAYVLISAIGADLLLRHVFRSLSYAALIALVTYIGWFHHYTLSLEYLSKIPLGFYGVQYGAKDLYSWIAAHHKSEKDIRVEYGLFNQGHIFAEFYLPAEQRNSVRIFEPLNICRSTEEWSDATLFVVSPSWTNELPRDGCPALEIELVESLRDPIGGELFQLVRIHHNQAITDWAIRWKEERLIPKISEISVNGVATVAEYPRLAMGEIEALFDGDPGTILRTDDINPGIFLFKFPAAPVRDIRVRVNNATDMHIKVEVFTDSDWIAVGEKEYSSARGDSEELAFECEAPEVQGIKITAHLPFHDENGSVHLSEMSWTSSQ